MTLRSVNLLEPVYLCEMLLVCGVVGRSLGQHGLRHVHSQHLGHHVGLQPHHQGRATKRVLGTPVVEQASIKLETDQSTVCHITSFKQKYSTGLVIISTEKFEID